ncbi:MAG: glycosyltransferase [Actinobacteria bacterium]|nr:glycosyltransferase [Actinomycetota bacterium]
MTTKPYVSVVIPTYNHAKFLKKALDSVTAQTFKDWEAVVVNNFSTDNTIEVVNSFADPRIKLLNFSNNGVIAASRNHGLREATGDFIAFLDSDDIWYSNKLQKCVEQASAGNQFICHGELWINSDLTQRTVMYGPASNATYKRLLYKGNCISTSTTFIAKSLLDSVQGFDENPEIITTEDYDLWLRLASKNPKTIFIPEVLGEFHRLADSASSSVLRNFAAELIVLKTHFSAQPRTITNRLRMRHRYAIAHYGAARQLTNQPAQAIRLFAQALKLSPFLIKIYLGTAITLWRAITTTQSPKG